MTKPALVGNAADEKQVKRGGIEERFNAKQELTDMQWILSEPMGRRFILKFLGKFGIARLAWRPGAEINRDVGHFECAKYLLEEVVLADPDMGAALLADAYKAELGIEDE